MKDADATAEKLAELLSRLSPEERTLLAQRLSRRKGDAVKPPLIPRRGEMDAYPLSFAQQRLWFLEQLEPGAALYNIPVAFRLRGRLDVAALAAALNEIRRRHWVLRASFRALGGEPVQVIGPARALDLSVVEACETGAPEEALVRRLAVEEAWRPFDLTRDPLLRASLMRFGEEDHLLVLTMHHIVSDGWSIGVLMQEAAVLYGAFCEGRPCPLQELPIQYTDYALWQREWLKGEALEAELAYWKGQLADAPPTLELPTDRPRPPVRSYRGETRSIILPPALLESLEALSRREGVTLFMLLLAAFKALLYRYTGQPEIVVGTPIAGRTHRQVAGLIGLFINTLVLRTRASGDLTFRQLLKQVSDVALSAFAHQSLPFEKLVDELQPARSTNQTPLFQVMFVLQNAPRADASLEDLTLAQVGLPSPAAKFDLTLALEEAERGMAASLTYNTDIFDAATAARMLGHLQVLLEAVAADAEPRLSELPLLTAAERRQIVEEWNDTARAVPLDKCVHELIALRAEQQPTTTALVYEGTSLTYEQLNKRANQLGHYLRSVGVGPEVKVGICLESSLETIVGLLGILKAGGAYVGLDPTLPGQRLAFMLEDTRMPVLLTQRRLLERLPEYRGQVVCLDADWPRLARESEREVVSGVTAANLSHVIYTSGSTGAPKAVMAEHGQLLYYLDAVSRRLECAADSDASFAMHQNLAVDAPVTFMFGAFLAGGVLHVIAQERATDPEAFGDYFQQHGIDYFKTAPSHMTVLLTSARPERVMPRRLLLLGGEASHAQLIERLRPLAPGCAIVNHYGPTETTVGVLTHRVTEESRRFASLPMGRPLDNTRAYVLDRSLNPAPVGVPGELCIGGGNVTRGYLNRPEVTAEQFIPDPFSGEAGARLYRTGDRARYLADGQLEFLGRLDHQVKIRGFRVELQEVEAVLDQHPAVRSAVVNVNGGATPDEHLAAYILARPESSPTADELRDFLREKLPEYMIPARFLLVEEMPRTTHGKLDRRALSQRQYPSLETARGPLGPSSTEEEELLLSLCANLLGRSQVSPEENFFELGGHSLLATQLLARVRQLFGIDLPLRALFESQSLGEFARRLRHALAEGRGLRLPPLRRRARATSRHSHDEGEELLPLSFAQRRLWFVEQLTPQSSAYNVSSVIRLSGRLDEEALRRALREIVARHESLRTSFPLFEGRPFQRIEAEVALELSVVSLVSLPAAEREEEWRRMAEAEASRPFDLGRAPLLRLGLLRLAEGESLLLITMHHIVSDGWSLTVFARELGALYGAYSEGRESPLEELAVQYADYSEWQRGWLQGEALDEGLGYWRRQLEGARATELPADRLRAVAGGYEGASYESWVSREVAEGLRRVSVAEGATLYMVLLGALAALLWRVSGSRDVSVGTAVAGRGEAGLEGLIGFFVNTLVVRVEVLGEESFRELVGRAREVALAAYRHQEIPFEKVVEELQPERDLSRNPLFQILFVLQNVPRHALRLPELSLTGVELESRTTRFDLELHVWEMEDGLKCVWIYSTQLYEAASIRRMAERFRLLLEELLLDPVRPVSELQFLSETERRQLLVEWNQTRRLFPPSECLHQGFEAQAELTPESIALRDAERRFSYRELNRRADQLADYLRALGVGPEELVGVMMQRSAEMVVALLGVLKAGAAYVPMDPNYPAARQRMVMEDAGFKVVLTEREFKSVVAGGSAEVVCLDERWNEVARREPRGRDGGAGRRNLAYALFTSGSTGRPKGVAIEHASATNFVRWSVEKFGAEDLSAVLFATSVCFDLSVFELFAPLSCGGQVILAENALQLSSLAAADEVRLINSVPSAAAALVQLKAVPESVRVVNLAGEALRRSVVEELYRTSRVEEVYNLYGPTEYTTYATCSMVSRGGSGEPNIGRPIANTQVYVLDKWQRLAGVGVVGEIYIGGAGLARGYLRRPEQTAERFIPDPFSQEEGARLYRTGDLGRWLAGGELEYLGRVDEQVKIRGYRIELGEVEAALHAHEHVRECAVAMREESSGDKRLLAYVVPRLSPRHAETPRAEGPTPRAEELASVEQVAKWELVWDETYRQPPPVLDPRFNIVGWISSYTGLPIPPEQMREWLDQTVERILALRPARLLEIGAGTGLLLFRLAASCRQYYATDFSAAALRYLEEQLDRSLAPRVTLLHRPAEDFTGLDSEAFDVVVLNSVVQYFPGVDYLLRVLEGAVKAVHAGGAVFVGDVRSLPLLEAFHASVQLRQAATSLSAAQLRQLVQKRLSEEQELVISPAFFHALRRRLPEITSVQIKLKRGRFRNELTCFRYDVILRVGEAEQRAASGATALDWERERLTLRELRRRLVESEPEALWLKGVPNARLEEENRTLQWLADGEGAETVGQWRSAARETAGEAIEPEDVWALGAELPYSVEVGYGPEAGGDGRFDVLLRRRVEGVTDVEASLPQVACDGSPEEGTSDAPWSHYANDPLRANLQRNLARQLRGFLSERLPDHMIPAAFIILDALPRTPNGKVDRRALPAPGQARPELEQGFVAPRTETEETLASIWSQVLGLERVGVFDNFFELGGDSILSIQVIARAHERGIELTPRQLFQNQTVAGLASVAAAARRMEAEQGAVTGAFPLTPWQRRFFEQGEPDLPGRARLLILRARGPLDAALLERAAAHLSAQHDALRARLVKGEGGWRQINLGSEGALTPLRVDLSGCVEDEREAALEAAALELRRGLAAGLPAQVAIVETGAGEPFSLLLMTSSLLIDERSAGILLEDLERAYGHLSRGEPVGLGLKTNSFKQWVELLLDYRHALESRQEFSYWMTESANSGAELPAEIFVEGRGAAERDAEDAARQLSFSLDAQETKALLEEVPRAYRTELREVLLTALAQTLIKRAGASAVLIDIEGEARARLFEGCDLSRTVGQFTTTFPLSLGLEGGTAPGRALQTVKEKLRAVPAGGLGYELLRYAGADNEASERLASLPRARILFRSEQPPSASSSGASLFEAVGKSDPGPDARGYLFEVAAGFDAGRLTVTWRYDERRARAEAVASLAEEAMTALRQLIAHCLSPGAGGYSLSDFKEFAWDADYLAEVTSLIEKTAGTAREALHAGRVEDLYPLSSTQEGILFHTLRDAASNLYLHQFDVLLEGPLDVDCFTRAWQKVVERHAILRTSFLWEGLRRPVQVVERGLRLPMQIEDWRDAPAAVCEARLAAFLEADRRRSFSLTDAPLMRLALVRLEEEKYHFVWAHHHLLLDGWSLNLVLREVLDCYETYRRGEEPRLPRPQPYRNYIAWLHRQDAAKSETFWRAKLRGLNRPTALGARTAAGDADGEGRYGDERVRFSKQATAALQAVAQQHQLTLSTVAQGVWALLLSRYGGEDDVVFGGVVSGRPARLPGVESMVGLFINTLPVRVQVDGEEWLLSWLRRLQEQEAEMREHQHSPLVEVHGWSDVPRTEPLFESIVSVDNYPVDVFAAEVSGGLRVGEVQARQRSNYPLAVVVVPGIELSVRISYDCRRFRGEMIKHLLDNYARLLSKVVSHPHATLNALQVIKEEEKRLVRTATKVASLDEGFNF